MEVMNLSIASMEALYMQQIGKVAIVTGASRESGRPRQRLSCIFARSMTMNSTSVARCGVQPAIATPAANSSSEAALECTYVIRFRSEQAE
jgi:hypothetical protein